ncbi:hypothetical protein KFE25_003943 [Diacronema lutheri]|uniref:Calx-beta domain-containing protein n=1 Tax=Diacronema lutheri TaxID=2081491 RepID=A0A8J6CBG1_DIALT|nr:hypothetical protein KFE25_003943 [Diacronema lutheri]
MGVNATSVLMSGLKTSAERLALISTLLAAEQDSSRVEPAGTGRGYVFYDGPGIDGRVTDECRSFLFFTGINLLDYRLLALTYGVALAFLFLGIAIISDVFMGAIEVITATEREKVVVSRSGRRSLVTYNVWNPTVANLTLMALGSSAPEIVLAIYGTIATLDTTPDELGPATIVGSAAYNLFVIIAICIPAVAVGETKRIEQLGVFGITSFASIFAYLWLFLCLRVISPGVVEAWEACVTLLLFPLTVYAAYRKDVGCQACGSGGEAAEDGDEPAQNRSSDPLAKPPTAAQLASNAQFASSVRKKRASFTEVEGFAHAHHKQRESRASISAIDPNLPTGAGEIRQSLRVREREQRDDGAPLKRAATSRERIGYLSSRSGREDGEGAAEVGKPSPRTRELAALMRTLTHIKDIEQQNRTHFGGLERVSTRGDGESKKSFAGLRHRMEAVRALSGQRRLVDSAGVVHRTSTIERGNDDASRGPSHADSAGALAATGRASTTHSLAADAEVAIFSFSQPAFLASASWPHAYATVVRRGANDTDAIVSWATVEPSSPRASKVFKRASDVLVFKAGGELSAIIKVPLTAAQLADPAPFQIALTAVEGAHALLSKKSTATIRTVAVKAPAGQQPRVGALQFTQPEVTCSEHVGNLEIEVERVDGSDGVLELSYRTVDGSALANVDYTPIEGTIEFGPNEVLKKLVVPVRSAHTGGEGRSLSLELFAAGALSTELTGEAPVDSCDITILDEAMWKLRLGDTRKQVRQEIAADFYATQSWAEQFRNAVILSGGVNEETGEQQEPTLFDSIMHMLSFFWKVLFACVPPTNILGAWPAFFVSLFFIALCTAAVSEFASNFGCVVGIPDQVTAITVVALGTSLPDTFASRVSVVRDETADNAVGNVTGSNAVNVYLGLGTPWIIGALYHQLAPSGAGAYFVPAEGLAFSVVVFGAFAIVTLAVLMARRKLVGGEVGGPKPLAYACSAFLVLLWLLYILLSSLYSTGQLPNVPL